MDTDRINIIELKNLSLGYAGRPLFSGANIAFGWGEFTALVGRNGTGKSTLLRTIAALAQPLGGEIIIDSRPLNSMSRSEIARMISFVSTDEVRVNNLQVRDVVGMGRAPYTNWIGTLAEDDHKIVDRALDLVGMSSFAATSVDRLSDGERQRVMIARALAQDTPIILLDEPTAFLDLPTKYDICLLLSDLARKEGKSVIFSTHDLAVTLELCDTVAMIDGGVFHYGTVESMTNEGILERLFTYNRKKHFF